MNRRRLVLGWGILFAALLLAGPELRAGNIVSIRSLVLERDTVPGVGIVTRIDNLAVNNQGEWIVEADTNFATGSQDSVLIKNGALFSREGDPVTLPGGASIGTYDTVNLNNRGDSGWNFQLDGTFMGSLDDSAVYFNFNLVAQESMTSTAPEFTPGTPFLGFFETAFNDSQQILMVASIDDPVIGGTVPIVDRALIVAQLDASGNLISETARYKEEDLLPGQTETIEDFELGPHDFAFNNRGQILFVANLLGDTSRDRVLYLDNTLLAQEGSPSPVPGRNWMTLTSTRVALNNGGGYAFIGRLAGSTSNDILIVANGSVLVREGDMLPAIPGFRIQRFGASNPIRMNDLGQTLWYGVWTDPDTNRDSGLFLDHCLLVQEGVTLIDGNLLTGIASSQDAYAMSDNGRFIIFEGTVDGNTDGAFLIELDPPYRLNPPRPGLAAQINTLTVDLATAGEKSFYAAGVVDGTVPIPLCAGQMLGMADPRLLGRATADGAGMATLSLRIPPGASRRRVLFQAVEASTCRVSNRVEFSFP